MARERSCSMPACKEIVTVKRVRTYLRDGRKTTVEIAMCSKCDARQCERCKSYCPSDAKKCPNPVCNMQLGLHLKGTP